MYRIEAKKYCILNKQYSKDEYDELLLRIIRHIGGTVASPRSERAGERESGYASSSEAELKDKQFGEFFPIEISPFCYNESMAFENFPLTKEEVLKKNLKWKEKDSKEYKPATYQPLDSIENVGDEILNEVLACSYCGKNYRIILQELKFYRRNKLPIPDKCPDCRYKERSAKRNPFKLWERLCAKCNKKIQPSYNPDRPETIYCEKCYLESLY
jgi:uncharacterized protein YbaR (Trm112 family)